MRNISSASSAWLTPGSASARMRSPTYWGSQDTPSSMSWASPAIYGKQSGESFQGRSPSEVECPMYALPCQSSPRGAAVDSSWRIWESRESDLVETAEELQGLLRCKERYERGIGGTWWGCQHLDALIHRWHVERAIFEIAIQGARKSEGKEHPTRDLLARVRTYFTHLYPEGGRQRS